MDNYIFEKKNLASKMINMEQLCGIREYVLENGPEEGIKVADFYNGSGLSFAVLKNRGLDIADTFYKGIPLHFKSFGGITAPSQGYNQGSEFARSFYGGLMITCGTTYTGRPSEDQGESLGLHGRHSNLRAKVETTRTYWDQEEFILEIKGEVKEAALFGPNVSTSRTIRTWLGKPVIEIEDVCTNFDNMPTPHCILYHFTFGFPLVDEGAELIYKDKGIQPLSDNVRKPENTDFRKITAPSSIHNGSAQEFNYIDIHEDANGLVRVGLINRRLGMGVALEYPKAALPRLGNWQHFGERGMYVTAFEPMNGGVEGRSVDRELGWLETLNPGQSKMYKIRMTVLTSIGEIDEFVAGVYGKPD